MLNKYKKISEKFDCGEHKFSSELRQLSTAVNEVKQHSVNTLTDINHINVIIDDIDRQFAEKTGISNPKDMIFLWGAVAMQCVRWILIPTLDYKKLTPTTSDRKDSLSEGKIDRTGTGPQINQQRENIEMQELPDAHAIMLLPVPYDAMQGTEDIVIPGVTEFGKQIYSMNHHAATLGHDPIVGQIIGTANIMTRSITFHDSLLTTRKVENPLGRKQVVVKSPSYSKMMMVEDTIKSITQDKVRLVVALLKENLHLQSDKYTKVGLPIPFLSAEMQQKLLDLKWNSKELEGVLKHGINSISTNYLVSSIINTIVGILHGFCYNEIEDESKSLYNVRTRKIVATSNVIAEGLNLGTITAGSLVGILSENPDLVKQSISHLDIGGMIEAIHQIVKSNKLQEEVRREFLEQELFNHFTTNKYSFLEDSYYE